MVIGGGSAVVSLLFIGRSHDELISILNKKGLNPNPDMFMFWRGFEHQRLQRMHAPHLFARQAKCYASMFTGILVAWTGIYLLATT